jgi:hypothetical protein
MKKSLLLLLPVALFAGCCATNFSATKPDGTKVAVSNYRLIWSTEAYNCNISSNSASLTANKSSTDSAAIAAVAQGVVQGMAAAAK